MKDPDEFVILRYTLDVHPVFLLVQLPSFVFRRLLGPRLHTGADHKDKVQGQDLFVELEINNKIVINFFIRIKNSFTYKGP